jgi:hypothetical protein
MLIQIRFLYDGFVIDITNLNRYVESNLERVTSRTGGKLLKSSLTSLNIDKS